MRPQMPTPELAKPLLMEWEETNYSQVPSQTAEPPRPHYVEYKRNGSQNMHKEKYDACKSLFAPTDIDYNSESEGDSDCDSSLSGDEYEYEYEN